MRLLSLTPAIEGAKWIDLEIHICQCASFAAVTLNYKQAPSCLIA